VLQAAADAGDVPGVVAVATNRDGNIYEGGFGRRNLNESTPMSPDTVVWIASMTKAPHRHCGHAAGRAGEDRSRQPVTRWVPDLARTQVLDGWDAGRATAHASAQASDHDAPSAHAHRRVRLRSVELGPGALPETQGHSRHRQLQEHRADHSACCPIQGDRWTYGIGIDWAGKTVEAVSGTTLGQYLKDNLFDPLGMSDTAFKITPDMRSRLAKVHQHGADRRKYTPIEFEMPQEPEFEMGGGGVYSTAGDYAKFVRMILNYGKGNGNQILSPQTVALMSRNAMGPLKVTMLKSEMPALTGDAEFFPGMPKNWGLSFMINEQTAPTGRTPGSLAWAGLANTYFWIDQNKGVGRRVHDAGAAVCRREGAAAVLRFREDRLPVDGLTAVNPPLSTLVRRERRLSFIPGRRLPPCRWGNICERGSVAEVGEIARMGNEP
jgi:CubicO group peptidase (beta-lactamase class C family)